MLRNLGHEPDGRRANTTRKQVWMIKSDHTSSDFQEGENAEAITLSSECCLRHMSTGWKALEVYFQMDPAT
jgi:hypothetical protein